MSYHKESYSDIPDGDFELIPAGKWPVKVVNAAVRPSKSSGMDTWCLDLEIEGHKFAGRKLWLYISMKPEAAPIRKGTMTALGLDTTQDIQYDLVDDVVGRKALAEIYHDVYQGQKREKVKRLRTLKEPVSKPATDDIFDEGFGSVPF